MAHQSLSTVEPDVREKFKRNLSLATSKSDTQRKEALAYLTGQLSQEPPVNPVGTNNLLDKLLPLISDRSAPVRTQLLKLFRALPASQVRHSAERAIMFVRAGMTHLSADISNDSLSVLEWLLEVTADEVLGCSSGWVKTLKSFFAMMGWALTTSKDGWSSGAKTGMRAKDAQIYARQIALLTKFLEAGLKPEPPIPEDPNWFHNYLYRIPRDPNAFAYLNLYGPPRDEETEMYTTRDARQGVFGRKYQEVVQKGVEKAKKEGGPTGRAAAALEKVIDEQLEGYEESAPITAQDLLDLW